MSDQPGDELILSDPGEVEYLTDARVGISEGLAAGGQVTMSTLVMQMTTRRGDPIDGPATTRTVLLTRVQGNVLMQALGYNLTA